MSTNSVNKFQFQFQIFLNIKQRLASNIPRSNPANKKTPQRSNRRLLLKGGGDDEWTSSTQSLFADGESDHDEDCVDRVISLVQGSTSTVSSLNSSTTSLSTEAQQVPPPTPTKSIGSCVTSVVQVTSVVHGGNSNHRTLPTDKTQVPPPTPHKEKKAESDNDRVGPSRLPVPLRLFADDEQLTRYECLIRKNLEFFEAEPLDVQNFEFTIRLGQVGLRCRHCAHRPSLQAMMFPRTYHETVISAESLASHHLNHCSFVSEHVTEEIQRTEKKKQFHSNYWEEAAKESGVTEGPGCLTWSRTETCFERRSLPLEFYHFKVTATVLASINQCQDSSDFCSSDFDNDLPSEPMHTCTVMV